ncbi:LysR substrate-binding domain-containing protein [Pseudooceanicola sp. C21-150M6]
MDHKSLHRFDLNLIKVFLAICHCGNLTQAADRLGLTQPAVSHALRRLRDEFGDPLFVRVGNSMTPSQTAMTLRPAFEQALRLVGDTVQASRQFDPTVSTRQFRIAMTDTGEFVILPRLLAALHKAAPEVTVQSMRIAPEDLHSALRTGQIDAAIGFQPGLEPVGAVPRHIMQDKIVCLFRSGHPLAGQDWTAETFGGLSFIDVGRDATGYRLARQQIADLGIPYRTVAQLNHFTIVPEILRRTDFVALFPYSVCRMMNRHGEFDHLDLPFGVPTFDVSFWVSQAFAADAALTWLYELLLTQMEC